MNIIKDRNIARVVFDPNDPAMIYAVLGGFNGGPGQTGHVFHTTISASFWTDISPALDLPFSGIALDGTDIPTTIYAGRVQVEFRMRTTGEQIHLEKTHRKTSYLERMLM
jgi:hypothetical protein